MKVDKTYTYYEGHLSARGAPHALRTYDFLLCFAREKRLSQTDTALKVAEKLHDGQYRKDGSPYIMHPMNVCCILIDLGIEDDEVLAASLLHDVLEDCLDQLPMGGRELIETYGISEEVFHIITLLTKKSGLNQQELGLYFNKIQTHPWAALIKLADRLHNSSSLYAFSRERMKKNIDETFMFVIPMANCCKEKYPEYANMFHLLKTCIYSLNHSMEVMLQRQ